MPAEPQSYWLASLVVVLLGGAGLAGIAAVLTRMHRQQSRLRRELGQQIEALGSRLLKIETRMAEREREAGATPSPRLTPPEKLEPRRIRRDPAERAAAAVAAGGQRTVAERVTLITVPDMGTDLEPPGEAAESALGERHGLAWTLAAAGAPPEEIANRTGQPIGQAELIVGLYRRLHSTRGPIADAQPR